MVGSGSIDSVDDDIALACGLLVLTDAKFHEAAAAADVTQWELEEAIESTELEDLLEFETDRDASETIDELFEGDH